MKNTLFTLSLVMAVAFAAHAQTTGDYLLQPKHVTGQRINNSGEVTMEFPADFSYDSDGKLSLFLFPEWDMNTTYLYEDNKLILATTRHTGGGLYYDDQYQFTYEGNLLVSEKHLWEYMNSNECYDYYYNEEGRLVRKEIIELNVGCNGYWLYEYDDQQKTITSVLHALYLEQGQWWTWGDLKTTVSRYDDEYRIVSVQTDDLNPETQEVTRSVRTLYSYNLLGRLESITDQTLIDGDWTNNTIEMRLYGDNGHVVEQQYGQWSDELNDWHIHRKITHELNEDELIFTISFYKKNGDEWVWDAFSYQKLLFEPELKWQQKALEQMIYDDLQEPTMMNRIVMTMEQTPRPTYMAIYERDSKCRVFPNPGNGEITVTVPTEKAEIRFYDLQGRLLEAKPFDFQTNVNTDGWTKGIYLWEIWNGTRKEASGKWVKE